MAVKLIRKRRKNADGSYDTIHYETQAKGVWFEDGQNIQEKFDNGDFSGGGSSSGGGEPDLVITMDASGAMLTDCANVSFDSAQVINVYNKLLAGESANCVVNALYQVHSGAPVEGCFWLVNGFVADDNLVLYFNVPNTVYGGLFLLELAFNIATGGIVSLASSNCRMYSGLGSSWM